MDTDEDSKSFKKVKKMLIILFLRQKSLKYALSAAPNNATATPKAPTDAPNHPADASN
jgi:hypothetical protein